MKLQIQLSSCTRFDISVSTTSWQNKRIKNNPETRKNDRRHNEKKWIQVKYIIRRRMHASIQFLNFDVNIFIWFSRVIGMESPIAAATEGSAISYWRPVHHRPARTYPAQLPLLVNFLLRWSMGTAAWL